MNTDINTQNKNLKDFFKNPLFIITAIPVAILWIMNAVAFTDTFFNSFLDFGYDDSLLGITSMFTAFFYSIDSLMYLILAVALVLLFIFANKNISLKAPFLLLKIFAIVSICIGVIQIIYSIIITLMLNFDDVYAVGSVVIEGNNNITALVSMSLNFFVNYVLTAIAVLLITSAFKKDISLNVISKKPVIVSIIIYILYLIPKLDLLWKYIELFTQTGVVGYYSFTPLLKSVWALLFIIIGIMYLTFFRVKREDESDDMEYDTVEETVEE